MSANIKIKPLFILFVFGGGIFFSACSVRQRQVSLISSLDANFRWKLVRSRSSTSNQSPAVLVSAYQHGLSASLATRCRMYPSDSLYFMEVYRDCGAISATMRSFARFSSERDLEAHWPEVTINAGQIRFVDLPLSCDWFD